LAPCWLGERRAEIALRRGIGCNEVQILHFEIESFATERAGSEEEMKDGRSEGRARYAGAPMYAIESPIKALLVRPSTPKGRSPMELSLAVAEIMDRTVLGRAIVPERHVARSPAPAHDILRALDVAVEKPEQRRRVLCRESFDPPREAAEQECLLPSFRVNADDRVGGLEAHRLKRFRVRPKRLAYSAGRRPNVVELVRVDRKKRLGKRA